MAELESFGSGGPEGNFSSPGGFEFGLQGWHWGEAQVKAVTFFLDGSAMVTDQYGRPIKGLVLEDQTVVLFAPCPPDADISPDGTPVPVIPRPRYATHEQVVDALKRDMRVDLVEEINATGEPCQTCKGRTVVADRKCAKCRGTGKRSVIACAGWPQLRYEQLKRLKRLPVTPVDELRKIPDPEMRKSALRIRAEATEAVAKESAQEVEA